MMGRLASDRSKFFYEFHVDDHVPSEHLVRRIDAVLDLSWLRAKLMMIGEWVAMILWGVAGSLPVPYQRNREWLEMVI